MPNPTRGSTDLSYAHGASSVPLCAETIGATLRRAVERFGEREALVVRHQHVRFTYRELWEHASRCARGLLAHGVQKGDRVGIWSPNRYEWVVLQYAAARVGAILVNVNPAYKPAELEYALRQSGVSLLVLARGFRQADYVTMLAGVRDRCPQLREALVLEEDWHDLLAAGDGVAEAELAAREAVLEFDDPINIQYTSGTTGAPKGATLSHHNVVNNAFFGAEQLSLTEYDRLCAPVPLYHTFGCVLASLACATHAACLVLPSESFEPLAVLAAVEAERCTALYGVPTMFIMELEEPRFAEFDLSSLRTGMMGGAPCPLEVMKKVQDRMHMREVTIICGMTETAP
ncbi:MAG: AMP-binding protein, partial [Chloroflexi bacterium]|nr:AMP-binding protein [Chloroflexota bacterium]